MDPTAHISNALASSSIPLPSPAFLTTLTSASTTASTESLVATAKSRILACDLARNSILDPSLASLPLGADDPRTQESRLPCAVHVQVLDVENLNLSRWAQIEELEAEERGESTRGREVVRVTADDEDAVPESQATQRPAGRNGTGRAAGGNATHRLVLQDCKGKKIFGVELKRVEGVCVGRTGIGEKILLRAGTTVARGVVLLTPESCVLLGGRVEAWHKAWMDGRLARLKESVGGDGDRP